MVRLLEFIVIRCSESWSNWSVRTSRLAILFALFGSNYFISCVDNGDSGMEVVSDLKCDTIDQFYGSGVLKSRSVYIDNELIYHDDFDSLGELIKYDRLMQFNLSEAPPLTIQGNIVIFGPNHPSTDSLIVLASKPLGVLEDKFEVDMNVIEMNRNGKYYYSYSVPDTGLYQIQISFIEVNPDFDGTSPPILLDYEIRYVDIRVIENDSPHVNNRQLALKAR